MGQMGLTERLDDEESESFEAQEESVPAAGDREDWPLHVSNFAFVASLELVDAYVCPAVCLAVSEKGADCRRDLEVLQFRPGQSRHELALVGSA